MKISLRSALQKTALGLALAGFAASLPAAQTPKRMLVLTESKGFTHSVVKRPTNDLCLVEKTLAEIAKTSGVFETVNSQNAIESLTHENLKKFDAIFFYTTGSLLPAGEPREALLNFVKSGKAFIGTHSATDTLADYKGYVDFINGNFNGHPWNSGTMCTFTNHEPTHPAVAMYPAEFQWKDEIYQYKGFNPKSVRVLLSLDMSKTNPKMPYHVPVCWVREYGSGRLFYTNLGHNDATWKDGKFQEHLLAGIRWAFKMEQGPATPNPGVQALENIKAFLVVAAPIVKKEWSALLPKVAAKAKDPHFMDHLAGDIADFQKLPNPDSKKATPQEMEAAQKARLALVSHVVETIEQ